jgi:GNAT superfamily N-acetyltransferase
MPTLSARPLAAEDLPAAARLLAGRHAAHRHLQPLLSERYESADECLVQLKEAFALQDASGAIATRGTDVVAFVLGASKEPSWGEHAWVEAGGSAASEPEALRDAYAVAAQRWYDEGRKTHYVLAPVHDPEMLDAWYRLGFGQMHAHALRPALPVTPSVSNVVLRRAEKRDIDQIAALEFVVPEHHGRSPVFSYGPPFTLEEVRADWVEDVDDPKYAHFVIDVDDDIVAMATGCAVTVSRIHTGLAAPDNAGFLGHAAVRTDARGNGYGRVLAEAVINWSYETGYVSVVNDWRVTNLLSSRTWPRIGWETTFLRLHRTIGPAG